MDWEHQRNKPNKGHSEKTEFNERGLRREGTVLKDEHIRKDIPTLYNSWTNNIYTQPPPYNYIWQQQTTREYAKTLQLSSFWIKEPKNTLGAATGEVFSSLNNSDLRPSNSLFQIARGSGATLSECTFFKKGHITQKTSSRQQFSNNIRFKTL
jgi:hypothetical protein